MSAIALGSIAVIGAAVAGARFAFERRMAREVDALLGDAQQMSGRPITERSRTLPEPVQRWLRYSNVVGTAAPATVRLRQDDPFQMEGGSWMPFTAEQYSTTTVDVLVSLADRDRYGYAILQDGSKHADQVASGPDAGPMGVTIARNVPRLFRSLRDPNPDGSLFHCSL
jgi:hypothetical protein